MAVSSKPLSCKGCTERVPAQIKDFHARIQHKEAQGSVSIFNVPLFNLKFKSLNSKTVKLPYLLNH